MVIPKRIWEWLQKMREREERRRRAEADLFVARIKSECKQVTPGLWVDRDLLQRIEAALEKPDVPAV